MIFEGFDVTKAENRTPLRKGGGGRQMPKDIFRESETTGSKKKNKAVDPENPQETATNHGRAGPSTTTDLEDVVSSVAERMLPEINKIIETIISKRLDTTEGSHVSFYQSATFNNQHSVPIFF